MNRDKNSNNESNVNGIPSGVVPIWIWRRAIEESDLPSGCRHVLQTIANDLSDTGKYTRMPVSELCQRTGLSVRTVEEHLRTATDMKFLSVRIRTDSNGYRLGRDLSPNFPPEFIPPEDLPANFADRDSQTANSAGRCENNNSQTANSAGGHNVLTANSACLPAKIAGTYIDNLSYTFPNNYTEQGKRFTEAFHVEGEKSTEKAVKPDISYKDLLAKLYEAAGDAVADEARFPGLACISDVHRWLESGCDLEVDILPTIRARSLGRRRWSIRSWSYFTDAVADAKARRLSPMPEGNGGSNNGNSYYGYKSSGAEYDAMMERLYAYQDELLAKEDENGQRNQELYRPAAE